ncbi:MAG TPA: hypothetical protein VK439_04955, partial [Rubrivivax sp.]|nr:hypothetical protein [Rubrivivax sp.]
GTAGRVFVATGRNPSSSNLQRRALFVPSLAGDDDTHIVLRGATFDTNSQQCTYGAVVQAIPLRLDPYVVVDAGLRYLAFTAEGYSVEVPSVTLQEIDWERAEANSSRIVQATVRAVVTDARALAAVRGAAGGARVGVVPSWRKTGGRAFAVGDQAWRVVSAAAQRLPVAADDAAFVALVPAPDGSPCALLKTGWSPQPGFRTQIFESAANCFAISRGTPEDAGAQSGSAQRQQQRDQIMVAVYEKPDQNSLERLADNPPAPIASLSPFGRAAVADHAWMLGARGPYAGWLALRGADSSGQQRLIGTPWSTCALWRLGREIQPRGPGAPGTAGGSGNQGGEQNCSDR